MAKQRTYETLKAGGKKAGNSKKRAVKVFISPAKVAKIAARKARVEKAGPVRADKKSMRGGIYTLG